MSKKYKLVFFILLLAGAVTGAVLLLQGSNIAVLNPKGVIASQERDLMIIATLLMLVVVIPVLALTFFIAWKYRAGNSKANYSPDWDHNRAVEFTWWAIPSVIIFVLAAITWKSTHQLDPFRPLEAGAKPITVQVVATQWKWLFIYPQQDIAAVNLVQFPTDTPVNFEITSDAPMNSFWIPQLGGQVYAMAGMKTKLHLDASESGDYYGSSANISGQGFASMRFTARASSGTDFKNWIKLVKQSPDILSIDEYERLARPSINSQVAYYSSTETDLLDKIVAKFTLPGSAGHSGQENGALSKYGVRGHH